MKKQRGFWIIFLQKRGSKNWLQFKPGHWMLGAVSLVSILSWMYLAMQSLQTACAHLCLLLNIWFDCIGFTHILQVKTGLACPLWALRIFCTYKSNSMSRSYSSSFCCVFPLPFFLLDVSHALKLESWTTIMLFNFYEVSYCLLYRYMYGSVVSCPPSSLRYRI